MPSVDHLTTVANASLSALLLVVFCVALSISADAQCSPQDRRWTLALAWLALVTALLFVAREVLARWLIGGR